MRVGLGGVDDWLHGSFFGFYAGVGCIWLLLRCVCLLLIIWLVAVWCFCCEWCVSGLLIAGFGGLISLVVVIICCFGVGC